MSPEKVYRDCPVYARRPGATQKSAAVIISRYNPASNQVSLYWPSEIEGQELQAWVDIRLVEEVFPKGLVQLRSQKKKHAAKDVGSLLRKGFLNIKPSNF